MAKTFRPSDKIERPDQHCRCDKMKDGLCPKCAKALATVLQRITQGFVSIQEVVDIKYLYDPDNVQSPPRGVDDAASPPSHEMLAHARDCHG